MYVKPLRWLSEWITDKMGGFSPAGGEESAAGDRNLPRGWFITNNQVKKEKEILVAFTVNALGLALSDKVQNIL